MTPALLTLCAVLIVPDWSLATAEGEAEKDDSPLASLLAKIPAKSTAEQKDVNAKLVELGPIAVAELCGKLVQPGTGDDTQARYALDGLSTYVHRPGAERERLMVAASSPSAIGKGWPAGSSRLASNSCAIRLFSRANSKYPLGRSGDRGA